MKGSEHTMDDKLETNLLNESEVARVDYEATVFEL